VNAGGPSSGDHRSAPGAAGSGVDEFLDASARAAPPEAVAATAQAPLPAGQTAPSSNPSPANGSASTVKDGRELLVNRDPLTELPHRQALAEMLKSALQRKRPGSSLSLLWIDLHQFKSINDRFGYRVGDRALREVAKRLRASIRSTDIIARLGGDEFAVVQEHAQGNDAVEALARHIACQLDRPFSVGGHKFAVGAYIGIAALGDERLDAEGLMRRADQALQEAKRDGRRGYRWFDGEFADRTRLRNQIRADLAIAIVREELTLNYQPIVDLAKHCVIGFEALLRWDHPVHGRINPSDFIPIAEESGLILPISDWVLKAACRDAVGWPGHVKVSVNLSPIQFKLGDPVHSIERALAASGLPPQRLECEITESTIIQDVDRTLAAVRKMKAWGATVSLDDFGTGYSSLNCLSLLPFDRIKIDRSFVTGADAGNGAFAILETIATLGRALGATTVLEGVETLDQLALAVSKGCSAVQGYLFSPPWPSDKALDIIADVNARASSYLANITVDPVL
jgi:diguanylate cyclase (GGDEF)-like protein